MDPERLAARAMERRANATPSPKREDEEVVTPFAFVRRIMEDADKLFGVGPSMFTPSSDDIFVRSPEAMGPMRGSGWTPEVELFVRDGNVVVRADLPGLDPSDVKVAVHDDVLIIEGARKSEHDETQEGVYHSERTYGSFKRRIQLPRGCDASTCDASMEGGVLEISMQAPKVTPRHVEVRRRPKKEPKEPHQA